MFCVWLYDKSVNLTSTRGNVFRMFALPWRDKSYVLHTQSYSHIQLSCSYCSVAVDYINYLDYLEQSISLITSRLIIVRHS